MAWHAPGMVLEFVIMLYALAAVVSVLGAALAEAVTLVASALGLALSVYLSYSVLVVGSREFALGGLLIADPVCAWGLTIVSTLGFVEALYSLGYVRHEPHIPRGSVKWYYVLFNATMLSMALSVASNNIILMWAAIEATTLATAFLVSLYETTTSVEAAWKYVIICGVGVAFALFGTVVVYNAGLLSGLTAEEAMTWASLVRAGERLAAADVATLLKLGVLLVVLGYITKAGLFPVHVWLPDAHGEAPAPISAILSGVIVKCALIVVLRYYSLALAAGMAGFISPILLVLGIASMVIGGLAVLVQKDVKRMFAYSTVDQVGVIATAAGIGTPIGLLAAVMHILYHAFAKALAFMGSGLIMSFTGGKRSIDEFKGLLRRGMRFCAAIIIIAVLGIAAVPPGPSFFSKVYLFIAAAQRELLLALVVLLAMLVAEAAIMYKMMIMVYGGLGPGRHRGHGEHEEGGENLRSFQEKGLLTCKAACVIMATILITLFVLVQPYMSLAQVVAQELWAPAG